MRLALLLIPVALCSGSSAPAQSRPSKPAAYATSSRDASDSIHQWEKDTRLKVDPEARAEIVQQATDADFSKAFAPKDHAAEALAWSRDVLIRSWLHALHARSESETITKAQAGSYAFSEFLLSLKVAGEPFGYVEFLSAPSGAVITRDKKEIGRTPLGFIVSGDVHDYQILLSKEMTCESTILVRPGTTEKMTCPQ
jgi:hypothetical protein